MFHLYSFALLVVYMSSSTVAGVENGYTYAKPTVGTFGYNLDKPTVATNDYAYQKRAPYNLDSTGSGGHYFPPLPTIKPIPAVPTIPALPTPRSKGAVHQQALFQTHPSPSPQPGASTYITPPTQHSSVGNIVQQYRPTSIPSGVTSYGSFAPPAVSTTTGSFASSANSGLGESFLGTFSPPAGMVPSGPNAPLESQPLRIPFGKSALIQYPDPSVSEQDLFGTGTGNGREITQYAVVEIIDNDIVQKIEPFLSAPVRNEYRAQFGATGTGASANSGIQLGTRSNINVSEQQRVSTPTNSDTIALGSGGLGFIRLSNGNVYLGSGSLGYISGQQLSQNVNEARTRSEQAQPDAVHFGHGSLGGGKAAFNRVFRFR